MSGRSTPKIDAGVGCQLVEPGQGEVIFLCISPCKSDRIPGIAIEPEMLQSDGSQNMKEHV